MVALGVSARNRVKGTVAYFVDAVVHATRAAQATHQEEKLEALRNGVLHSLLPDASSEDEQARFFRLIDQFTPAHLHLLELLDDAGTYFDSRSIQRPPISMGGRIHLVTAALGVGEDEWWDLIDRDLANDSRVHGPPDVGGGAAGLRAMPLPGEGPRATGATFRAVGGINARRTCAMTATLNCLLMRTPDNL